MNTKTLVMRTQFPEIVEQLLNECDCIKHQNGYIVVGPQPGTITVGYWEMGLGPIGAAIDMHVWVANAQGCGLIQDCIEITREKQ